MPDAVVPEQEVGQYVTNIALPWLDGGCSVIPIRPGGTKAPYFDWKRGEVNYQETRPTRGEVRRWWEVRFPQAGVAVICGKVSGNLELVELEGRAADGDSLSRIKSECELRGVEEIWSSLLALGYAEWSPSGGIHVLYRVPGHDIPGNTKLAMRVARSDEYNDEELKILADFPDRQFWRVLAETRGEGGYVIVAPTGGNCHKSGEPWTTVAGKQGVIPCITWSQRMAIHAAITAALDARPEASPTLPRANLPAVRPADDLDTRPGTEFNRTASWEDDWFTGQGWKISHRVGGETFWVRPGKDIRDGHSASTGYRGDSDCLYVWSTSAGLPTEEPLSKFRVYAFYHHNDDMRAAARALSRLRPDRPRSLDVSPAPALSPWTADSKSEVALPSHGGLDLTDTGSGRRMKEQYGDTFRFNTIDKKWYMWTGSSWIEDRYQAIQRAAVDVAERVVAAASIELEEVRGMGGDEEKEARKRYGLAVQGKNDGRLQAAIRRFSTEPGISVTPEDFDRDPNHLNLPNGTLELDTGTLRPHDPADLNTLTFGASYNPDATCPLFDQFMVDAFPDVSIRDYVQRALGYSMLGVPQERAMFMLHGPSGTGKSVLTSVMTEMFSGYGQTAPATTFRLKKSETSFDLHQLRRKRFVATSEMPEGAQLDEELVKRVTGNDIVSSRGLYEPFQSWRAQCVVWIATNFLPKVNSDDNAMWRRTKSVPMNTEFGTANGPQEILGYHNHLLTERDGILNWLLAGLQAYQAQGLDEPDAITKDVEAYRLDVDTVSSFVRDQLEEGVLVEEPGAEIRLSAIQVLYQKYCTDNHLGAVGRRRLGQRLRNMGYIASKVGGHSTYVGLRQNILVHGVLGSF